MKDTVSIEVDKDCEIEIHYEHWSKGAWLDYDVPPDPAGHEVEKIELHIGEHKIDITYIAEELSSLLSYDKMEEAIISDINS